MTRRLIELAVFLVPLAAHAAKWHRATSAECDAEYRIESQEMADARMCCDPPIGMASAMQSDSMGHEEQPCGYTDGSGHFRTLYIVTGRRKACELTKRQYDDLYRVVSRDKYGKTLEMKAGALAKRAKQCDEGRLPQVSEVPR